MTVSQVVPEPRVFVSNEDDAASYAKKTWYPEIQGCLIIAFDYDTNNQSMCEQYKGVFKKFLRYQEPAYTSSKDTIKSVLSCGHDSLVVIINPPSVADLTSYLDVCQEMDRDVLVHFSTVNACFEQLPSRILKYVYDVGSNQKLVRAAPCSARHFTCVNQVRPVGKLALRQDKPGCFVINLTSQDHFKQWGVTTSLVMEHFAHDQFVTKPDDAAINLRCSGVEFHIGDPIVFVPSGSGSMFRRYLIYNPLECPDLLVPGCLHIFLDMTLEAARKLCDRVKSNPTLFKTSTFVCVARADEQLLLADFTRIKGNVYAVATPEAIPAPKVAEPEAKVTEPEAKVTEPEAKVTEPEAKVAEPEAKVTEPEAKVTEPDVKVAEPEAKVTEPDVKVTEPEVKDQTKEQVVKEGDSGDRVLFVIKERTLVAERETKFRFSTLTDVVSGQKYTLERGFPVEGQYALFVDGHFICHSAIEDGKPVFRVLADFPSHSYPYMFVIEMTNATEERYLCSPATGEFYFHEYVLTGPNGKITIVPRMRYRLKTKPAPFLGMKTSENRPFTFISWTRASHFSSEVDGEHRVESILPMFKTNSIVFNPEEVDTQIAFTDKDASHFCPRRIRVTETYIDRA
jgi:hypothetical protein